jgi:hypothetical protein
LEQELLKRELSALRSRLGEAIPLKTLTAAVTDESFGDVMSNVELRNEGTFGSPTSAVLLAG